MTDPRNLDHWNQLAELIGADVPKEPAEEQEASEPEAACAPHAVELTDTEQTKQPEPVDNEPAVAEPRCDETWFGNVESELEVPSDPEPVSASERAEPPAERAEPPAERAEPLPPAPVSPAPSTMNHWHGLAGELGLDIPEEVFEDPPEEEPEEPADAVATGAEPVTEAVSEPKRPPVHEPPAPRQLPSLFDDPRLSTETPGVLDRIFEEDEAEQSVQRRQAATAAPAADERPAALVEPDFQTLPEDDRGDDANVEQWVDDLTDEEDEGPEDLSVAGDDEAGDDEAGDDEAGDDDETGDVETGEATAGAEPRRRRRKRRRRRANANQEPETSAAEETEAGTEEAPSPPAASETAEEPAVAATPAAAGGDEESPTVSRRAPADDDEPATLGIKHRKIPTWSEAVRIVIAVNQESRAKNPNGQGRGRGRTRGRRS